MSIKLNDPDFLRNPAPFLAQLQASGPLVRIKVPIIGTCWATTTDAAARSLLKDSARFLRNPASAGGRDLARLYWFLPRFMRPLMRNMLTSDGQAHARLRGAVEAGFSRAQIETLRPEITELARTLLDGLDPSAPIDITARYARPLPLLAICALLGIRPALRAQLTRAIAPISGPTGIATLLRALPGLYQSIRLLRAEIAAIRSAPRAGLLSALIHGKSDLSDDELLSMAFLLFVAGHETTQHLISDAIYDLSTQDARRARFCSSGRDQTALAVEEYLRFFSPVMMTKPLYVAQDTSFEGQPLKTGDQILALLISANHDEARFDAPEHCKLDRRPNAHLAFGFGPHVCLGMHLARIETQIALTELFSRYPDLAPASAAPPVYARRFGLRGIPALRVTLGARARLR